MTKDVVQKIDDATKRMKEALQKQLDITQYKKQIDRLEKEGIHLDTVNGNAILFNCDTHIYLPEVKENIRDIIREMDCNLWYFNGPTMKLKLYKFDFSYHKPKL